VGQVVVAFVGAIVDSVVGGLDSVVAVDPDIVDCDAVEAIEDVVSVESVAANAPAIIPINTKLKTITGFIFNFRSFNPIKLPKRY